MTVRQSPTQLVLFDVSSEERILHNGR